MIKKLKFTVLVSAFVLAGAFASAFFVSEAVIADDATSYFTYKEEQVKKVKFLFARCEDALLKDKKGFFMSYCGATVSGFSAGYSAASFVLAQNNKEMRLDRAKVSVKDCKEIKAYNLSSAHDLAVYFVDWVKRKEKDTDSQYDPHQIDANDALAIIFTEIMYCSKNNP